MKIILVSKCSLDIEQYVEFEMLVLISPSKSLISSCWVTYDSMFPREGTKRPSFTDPINPEFSVLGEGFFFFFFFWLKSCKIICFLANIVLAEICQK